MMKLTYNRSIFFYFFLIFALFVIGIILIERDEERKYKEQALEERLDSYAEIVHSYLTLNHLQQGDTTELSKIAAILPEEIRLTVIDNEGKVLYDKNIDNYSTIENHLGRPEIRKALFQSYGTNIRRSTTVNTKFLYYAKHYSGYFVRVALPYNIQTEVMLKPDNMFIYLTLGLFFLVLVLLNFAANRFGKSITQIKNLIIDIKEDKPLPQNIKFRNDELGAIAHQLFDIVRQKELSKQALEVEKEKLIQHFQYSGEGWCTFSKDFKKIYANTLFIQYLNFIINKATADVETLFHIQDFACVYQFLNTRSKEEDYYSTQLSKNGRIFLINVVVFEDDSFEITLKDITKVEKNRRLKQEMTSNIAHELRTPLTSIRGYLETLHENNLPNEKQQQFIDNAYKQALRLSALVDDISLISKIEETASSFTKEKINLFQVINSVRIDLVNKLLNKNITMYIDVDDKLTINANHSLIYSLFRNLVENSIAYGGDYIDIHINNYMQDNNYVYFSYYDTGVGVPEQHLNRLFERFYRVNEGRSRDTGGSGLGLSIVRNAIHLHKGEIQVRNREEGGLEFLFTLLK